MTINFNQYEVGLVPRSGTTSTTTFCFTTSTTTTTSSSPIPTTTSSSIYNKMRQGYPLQQEYNGFSSLHVVQSRARCRTPPAQPLVTCPGERGLPSIGVLGAAASINNRMEVDSGRTTANPKLEPWPECFQDLRSWCPQDRDELNTPQIIMQNEFNFPDGQVNWNYVENPPVEYISDSWENDLHLASNNNDEENNNYPVGGCINEYAETYVDRHSNSENKFHYSDTFLDDSMNVLKTKGNILLSQTLEESPQSIFGEVMPITDYVKSNSSQTAARLGSGGKIVKFEESEEFQSTTINETPTETLPIIQQQTALTFTNQRKHPTEIKKSRLQLKIPQTTNEPTDTLSTPEVLKQLTDIPTSTDFDLLKFVVEGITNTGKSHQNHLKKNSPNEQDHDYVDQKISNDFYIKAEPLSPQPVVPSVGVKRDFQVDDSDLDSDDQSNMMDDDEDDDSESEDWSPEGKRRRKSTTGKRRGRKPSSIDSYDNQDKYRALRDRNNEASRRSRLNRKTRDMEMKRQESDLARRNVELRVKANSMESHVKRMREALLKLVRSGNR